MSKEKNRSTKDCKEVNDLEDLNSCGSQMRRSINRIVNYHAVKRYTQL